MNASPPRPLFLQHASLFEQYGGVEYYLDDVVTLAAQSYGLDNVVTVVPGHNNPALPRAYQTVFVPRAKLQLIRKLQNRFFFSLLKAAEKTIQQLKPTFIFNTHVSLGPLAKILSWKWGIPVATCVYGIDAWGDLYPQDEWCLRRADRIISISHWTKKVLTTRGFSPNQIGIVHPRLPKEFESLAPKSNRPPGPLQLLTISRLDAAEQYKGHDHVIQALSLLKQNGAIALPHYTIQGDGNDKARLERLVQELGLSDLVTFRPGVKDRREFVNSYRQADVFIMPSRFGKWEKHWRGEGFGIVYVEAAALAVPSLAYDCGGATDIIVNGKTGWLVAADDISALATKIGELSKNLNSIPILGERARAHVVKKFGESTIAKQMEKEFSQILALNKSDILEKLAITARLRQN